MQLLVFVLCLSFVAGQPSITNLALSDEPTNERGYIIATAITDNRLLDISITSPVCGSVDLLTGWIACMSVGWLGVTGVGNAEGLGIEGPNALTEQIMLNNLTCTSFTNTAAGKEFQCTVSTTLPDTRCESSNVAAVSCYFSIGQVAGIAAGILALCLLVTVLPIIICCICCCCGICCAAASNPVWAYNICLEQLYLLL